MRDYMCDVWRATNATVMRVRMMMTVAGVVWWSNVCSWMLLDGFAHWMCSVRCFVVFVGSPPSPLFAPSDCVSVCGGLFGSFLLLTTKVYAYIRLSLVLCLCTRVVCIMYLHSHTNARRFGLIVLLCAQNKKTNAH